MGFVSGKDLQRARWLFVLMASVLLQACGGGGGGHSSDGAPAPVSFVKRAGVSTYAGSTVSIEYYDSVSGWQPLATLSTSDSDTVATSGLFDLSDINFLDDTWYRFTATGGVNLDADMDGEVDTDPLAVTGRLRALAKGQWLQQQGGTYISAATEFAYTSLHKLLVADVIDWSAVESGLQTAAKKLLLDDQTGDGLITADDLLAQDPQSLYDNLHYVQRNQLSDLNELLAAGLSSQLTGTLNGKAMGNSDYPVNEMVMDSEGRTVYAAAGTKGVLIHDLVTGEESIVKASISSVNKLTLAEGRGLLYVAGGSAGVRVIDLATQSQVDPLLSSYGSVSDVLISQDESHLYVATGDGFLVYDLEANSYEEFAVSGGGCVSLTLSEAGSQLGVGCFTGIRVYDTASGEVTASVDLADTAYTVLLDGDTAYVANKGEGLTIVDLTTGDHDSYPTPNDQWLQAIAPSSDTNTLAILALEGNYTFDLSTRTYGGALFPDIVNYSTDYAYYSERYDTYLFDYEAYAGGALATTDSLEVVDGSSTISTVALNASRDKVYYSDYYNVFKIYQPESAEITSFSLPDIVGGFTVNAAETKAWISWLGNGYFVLDLSDGSVQSVDLGKTLISPQLDESAGLLYVINNSDASVQAYSLADNSLVSTLDYGTCSPLFLRLSEVEHALDVACANNGIRRMDLDAGTWTQMLDSGSYIVSFDYNADESKLFFAAGAKVKVYDTDTDTVVQTVSYSGGDSNMRAYGTEYWPALNAVVIGGNQGVRFVSLDTEKQYWLQQEFGNSFAIDSDNKQLYVATGSDGGLKRFDMSDFE